MVIIIYLCLVVCCLMSSVAPLLFDMHRRAYRCSGGSGGVTHAAAVCMLGEAALVDLGARDFMRALAGPGD